MSPAALVLVCTLGLLGRSADQLPPIRILETRPSSASANADAFVNRAEGAIYLIASAPAFRQALAERSTPGCRPSDSLKMVASIIVHEEWHLTHGSDERGAYYAQLTELRRLGLGPGRWPYHSVTRAMNAVLDAQSRRASRPPNQVVAGR
jgi:hypothetical protein